MLSFKLVQDRARLVEYWQQYWQLLILLAFASLSLIGILNHAMWRDELNVWMITRDSHDLQTLFENVRYEGHPLIWYLCLFGLNQITSNPIAMQLLHWFIGVINAGLLIFCAPFSRYHKILFVFGYFSFYEFLFLSRNYSIGILCLFVFCILFPTRKTSYIPLSITLFLLANTNAFAMFLSLSLGIMLVAEYCFDPALRQARSQNSVRPLWDLLIGLILWGLGLYASLKLLIPPNDANLAGGWEFTLQFNWNRFFQVLSTIWKAYLPVLKPADRHVLPFGIISIGLWLWVSSILIRKPYLLLLNSLATSIMLSFCYVKFIGSERHHAHVFLTAIACFWLADQFPDHPCFESRFAALLNQPFIQKMLRFFQRYQKPFWTTVLISHFLAGIVAYGRDFVLPYSASRETAAFIQAQQLDKLFIVGSRDFAVSPLAGYLNRQIYYPEIQNLGSFVLFRQSRREVDLNKLMTQLTELIKEHPQILLILTPELKPETMQVPAALKVEAIAQFTHSLISNEKYYLYRVQSTANVAATEFIHAS